MRPLEKRNAGGLKQYLKHGKAIVGYPVSQCELHVSWKL